MEEWFTIDKLPYLQFYILPLLIYQSQDSVPLYVSLACVGTCCLGAETSSITVSFLPEPAQCFPG